MDLGNDRAGNPQHGGSAVTVRPRGTRLQEPGSIRHDVDTKEIIKNVRQIEIRTRGLVNQLFSGEYHSVFKGRGMEFSEVREYEFGDDVRTIDWNVSARFNRPFVKVFEEERELTVMLLVDMSGSQEYGTGRKLKRDIAAEMCAVLAFSALKNLSLIHI